MAFRTGWNLPPGVTQQMIDDAFDSQGSPCVCFELRQARTAELIAMGFDEVEASEQVELEDKQREIQCEACIEEHRRAMAEED